MTAIKLTDRNKPWAKRTYREDRLFRQREIRNLFRIYCEGENTEPEYFRSFPVNTETRIDVIGLGRSRTALVEKTIELCRDDEILENQKEYDESRQLWVVFDYDTRYHANEKQDYNRAINLAMSNKIKVAYSNDCFELWFVLHYQYHDTAITRQEYYRILSEKQNCNYETEGKSKEFSKSLYPIFLPYQNSAIKNANRLYDSHGESSYCDQNPCTLVYQLVEELNKCIKK